MLQIARFPHGSYAVHKIPAPSGKGHISMWFAADGTPLDAEHILPNGTSRPVRPNGPSWQHAAAIGRAYRSLAWADYHNAAQELAANEGTTWSAEGRARYEALMAEARRLQPITTR